MNGHLTVVEPGVTAVTDLGRPAAGRLGQMRGGALDQYAARVANTLVANDEKAPLIEALALDCAFGTSVDLLVAVTGAPSEVTINGVRSPQWQPVIWPAGTELHIANMRTGMRVYLAVHAALHAPMFLGSCAPDSVLGFSGRLQKSDEIQFESDHLLTQHPRLGVPAFPVSFEPPVFTDPWTIPVTDGPDRDHFGVTVSRLFDQEYTITPTSNHIGLRCAATEGGLLPVRESQQEILSRGVPVGAVEVPPGNELLILHRGRGVSAGYPVMAVVTTIGLDRLGQAKPGQSLSFERVNVEQAVAQARARRVRLDVLRRGVEASLSPYNRL